MGICLVWQPATVVNLITLESEIGVYSVNKIFSLLLLLFADAH